MGLSDKKRLEHLESIVNALDGVVWEFDWSTGAFTWVSAGAERLLGYPLADWLVPGFWTGHLHDEDRDFAVSYCIAATEDGLDHEFEYRMFHADGTIRWLRDVVSVDPVLRMDGPLRGVLVDITAQKTAEESARQSQEVYQTLVELSPYAIFVIDAGERFVYANDAAAEMLSAPAPEALRGMRISALFPRDDEGAAALEEARTAAAALLRHTPGDATSRSKTTRAPILTLAGRRIEMQRTAATITFAGEPALLVIARDITRELEAERALREQHDFLGHLLTMLDSGVVVLSGEPPLVVQINEPAERLLGWEPGELVGESARVLFSGDDDWRDFNERLRHDDLPVGGIAAETPMARQDGSCFDAEIAVRPLGIRPGEYIAIFRDVTERLAMEREEREHQKRLSALMAEVTDAEDRQRRQLAEELHDRVSQPLAVSRLHLAGAVKDDGSADPAAIEAASEMLEEAISQARALTTALYPPVLRELGLGPALGWLAEELERTYRLQVEVALPEKEPRLEEEAASVLFRTARELLVNVAKHAGATQAWMSLDVVAGSVVLTVADNGHGFESGAETGFGLFSIRERLPHLGGSVEIESELGSGARITVSVPEQARDA